MSETTSADQLPILPETELIEPIVQCGVLYLGAALPSPGLRGLDSVQEPFAHRYPVDGTNTAQGIDAILSVYDNGVQLTFTRQPYTVIFFPLTSLIYCASLRFSIVENDQTSSIDWRFVTLDSTVTNTSKHPPLFCAVLQRTHILSGDECHCFITKSDNTALALVRIISEAYGNLKSNPKPLKSPIFYQLDRYGRKISETSGTIYISPATKDDSQLNQNLDRYCLLDPSFDGFFYRTDATIIEQWQLWDDDDLIGSRPRPPPSPFGQREGLYHDDTTHEIHQYLRDMDDDDESLNSSSSSEYCRYRRTKQKAKYNMDQFNVSLSRSQTGTFDPLLLQNNVDIKRLQQAPIIIEKILPNSMMTPPQKHTRYALEQSQPSFDHSIPMQSANINYSPSFDNYKINERGEKITKEGNRIVFMDVVQPTIPKNKNHPQSYIPLPSRSLPRRHRPKPIPMIDLRSIESLFNDRKAKQRKHQRRTSIDTNENLEDTTLTTSDKLEIVDGYFEDNKGRKINLNGLDAKSMLDHLQSSTIKEEDDEEERASTIISSNNSSHHKTHRHRQTASNFTGGPSVNYVERPTIKSPSPLTDGSSVNYVKSPSIKSSLSPSIESDHSAESSSDDEQTKDYVSNIYGQKTNHSSSSSSSINQQESQPSNNTNNDQDYISPFRYMQSSLNPLLLREYRSTYTGN